jgi:hypothetical protein
MILGTAAGVAAAQVLAAGGVAVQELPVGALQARLAQLGQKLHWPLNATA